MYITFNKATKIVEYIGEKKPVSYSSNLELAEYYGEFPANDYLTVVNERQETEGKERKFLTCDLVANFNPPLTEEQLAKKKERQYEALVERLIRQKYSLSNEIAILRQATAKPEEFTEYNAYAEDCKAKAKAIIDGGLGYE